MGNRTFLVELPDLQRRWKRHINQIKKITVFQSRFPLCSSGDSDNDDFEPVNQNDKTVVDVTDNVSVSHDTDNVSVNETSIEKPLICSRPTRDAKPVDRLMFE